jgi:DNA polymerase
MDCETYSEAGCVWNEARQRWEPPPGAKKRGISACGTAAYAEHETTDVLTLTYRLPVWWDGDGGKHRWKPGDPPPYRLFAYLAAGHPIESHKAMFERLIWENVLVKRYGFPPLNPYQQRCSMATARVNQYPGALVDLSAVLRLPTPKDADGKRLLEKFSVPRNPTKKDPRRRVRPEDDPADFERLRGYCDTDDEAEDQASERMWPMTEAELLFWWIDQEINYRGLGVDRAGVRACIVILNQALAKYGEEFRTITGGLEPSQLQAFQGWLSAHGVRLPNMQEETIDDALKTLPPHPVGGYWPPRRALEIRQLTGSASVKKLFAMENQACRDDRLRDLLQHHGARTGRPTGEGPQPLNLPKAGPKLATCGACARPFRPALDACPWCASKDRKDGKPKWAADMVDHVLEVIGHGSLELVEWFFGDALLCISGCIRGLFQAAPGHELIASDYSAIEAVVIAMLAGEEWRIQAFRENKPIYLLSASKITGRSLEEYEAYHAANGEHHPDRQDIGKVAELGLGFGGWINAWLAFDDSGKYTDDEIKRLILAWRDASPAIVEFWGGQHRGRPWDRDRRQEYYGVEGHAVLALLHPGTVFTFRGLQFYTKVTPVGTQALVIRLLSGRELIYHDASLSPSPRDPSEYAITYWTWNSNPKYGAQGWGPMATFGGRLTENIVQATAHDIMRHAVIQLRAAGYPTVLHVYDEIVGEIPIGTGSLEEFERIMSLMPWWCADWPVRASGGWRGRRYRKG